MFPPATARTDAAAAPVSFGITDRTSAATISTASFSPSRSSGRMDRSTFRKAARSSRSPVTLTAAMTAKGQPILVIALAADQSPDTFTESPTSASALKSNSAVPNQYGPVALGVVGYR